MLQLGAEQYKQGITFKDVVICILSTICEHASSTFIAVSFLLLGIVGNKLYEVFGGQSATSLNNLDYILLTISVILIIVAILTYFLWERPQKDTIQKYRTKNLKLRNNYFNHIKILKLKQLKKQEIDIQSFWHDLLSVISKAYDFTSNERLSIFAIEEDKKYQQETSIMIGRYSENRDLCKKNRGVHPINQGCIGLAWNSPKEYFFKNDFPENTVKHEELLKNNYKFPSETIAKLRMKAKTIGCVVLHNLTNTDRVAVLVFESIDRKSKTLTEEVMLAIYKEYKAELQSIIDTLKDYIPLISVDNELEES